MGKSNTSMRLKQLMDERNLRQVDILNLTKPYCEQYNVKMNKSDISQYVSGKNEPSQDKLVILGMALGVSEAWLMGYDVPEDVKEDLNLLKNESELQIVIEIFEKNDYKIYLSTESNKDVVTIKDSSDNLITCIHENDLLNIYEYLKRNNIPVTTDALLDPNNDPLEQHMMAFHNKRSSIRYLSEHLKHDCTNIVNTMGILNADGLKEAEKRILELQYIPKYRKETNDDFSDILYVDSDGEHNISPNGNISYAAHEQSNTEITEESKNHDGSITNNHSTGISQ